MAMMVLFLRGEKDGELQQARETKEDATARYVLYRHARQLAEKAAAAPLALTIVSELAREFDVGDHRVEFVTRAKR